MFTDGRILRFTGKHRGVRASCFAGVGLRQPLVGTIGSHKRITDKQQEHLHVCGAES